MEESCPPYAAKQTSMHPDLWTIDNPVFCCYLLWSSVLVLKMLSMSALTGFQRFRNKVFISEEDTIFVRNSQVQYDNPHVNRVRRAHRNDMENILPYFIMALMYIATDPDPTLTCWLIRITSVSRIVHSLVYAFYPVPQPTRFFAFIAPALITTYMGFYVAFQFLKYV